MIMKTIWNSKPALILHNSNTHLLILLKVLNPGIIYLHKRATFCYYEQFGIPSSENDKLTHLADYKSTIYSILITLLTLVGCIINLLKELEINRMVSAKETVNKDTQTANFTKGFSLKPSSVQKH